MSYLYLANPYIGTESEMQSRYQSAARCTYFLLSNECWVYSPIVHCHELARKFDLPKDSHYWRKYNTAMLMRAASLGILCLPGWRQSVGVSYEMGVSHDLPQYFIYEHEDNYLFLHEPMNTAHEEILFTYGSLNGENELTGGVRPRISEILGTSKGYRSQSDTLGDIRRANAGCNFPGLLQSIS